MRIKKVTLRDLPRSEYSPTLRATDALGPGEGIRIEMSVYRAEQVATILKRIDVSKLEQPYRRVYEELFWGLGEHFPAVLGDL